jgi:hypothetical protein
MMLILFLFISLFMILDYEGVTLIYSLGILSTINLNSQPFLIIINRN